MVDGLHAGQRRRLGGDQVAEPGHGRGAALDLRDDALRGVGHVSGQGEFGGEAVEVGPEAHALYHSPDGDPAAAWGVLGDGRRSLRTAHEWMWAMVPVASGCACE